MKRSKKVDKQFGLSTFSIKNSTSIFVLMFIILIMGLQAYKNMPKESFPEIVQPTIYVGTPYPGNSPVDMENLITRPIEKELKGLKGIKKFTSTSIQDYATIVVEFELDVDPQEALTEVKDAVDRAKPELPNDLPADPNIFELDFTEFPVMNINIFGDFSEEELKDDAEYLQDEFEKLSEVSAADIRGLTDEEVAVSVDLYKMQSLQIGFTDIERAIQGENVSQSGGDILSIQGDSRTRRNLRIDGEFDDYHELTDIIVKSENQEIVRLGDIASVSFGPIEPTSFARLNGQKVVTLDVKKKSGANLLDAASQIKDIIEEAREEKLPSGMNVVITNDQSKMTRNMVNNLENSIISGIILVVLILLFFLGARNALFVGIAIPLSMLMGIAILNATGTTLNMMVLFSLILALGMLVDNGIVVVENIYRLYVEGRTKIAASRQGVGEVAWPIISSTATTLAAFLPLLFWNDLMGEFMRYLPITLMIVLSSSLFVGLVINPVLTSRFIAVDDEGKKGKPKRFWLVTGLLILLGLLIWIPNISRVVGGLLVIAGLIGILHRYALKPAAKWFQSNLLVTIENFYEKTVSFAVHGKRPYLFFVGMFVLMFVSLMIFGMAKLPILFFPDNEPNYVNVFVEMPLGTDIRETNAFAQNLESKISEAIEPNRNIVEAVLTQVGEGTSDPNAGPQQGSSPHKARITVSFYEYEVRVDSSDVSTSQVMQDIKDAVRNVPGAIITVAKDNMGPPVGPPINIEMSADDFEMLMGQADKVFNILQDANVPGVDKLKVDLEKGKPQLSVTVDRSAVKTYGLSTRDVVSAIRTSLFGREVSKYKEGDEDYDINIRLNDDQRYNLPVLLNQTIPFRDQNSGKIVQVPISAVTDIKYNSTLGSVKRKDMDRVITIFSEVEEGANPNAIVEKYKEILATEYDAPPGVTLKFTGEQEEQAKSMAFLTRALIIALLIIGLILVSQFNSVVSPIIILFSVLFSTIGVFLGFAIFQMPFVILMCGIGIISLAGVVVNNAIVLIDYINLIRTRRRVELNLEDDERLPYNEIVDSIIQGGKTRFRPVILTAITTVLGLVPLAIGMNINFTTLLTELNPDFYVGGDSAIFWGPMAWTVIFGLIFATFLTLVIVPVMYLLTDRLSYRVSRMFKRF